MVHQLVGSGEQLVVLLHSGGMSGRQWRRLAEALSPGFRVLLPDFLGTGGNPPWPVGQPFHFQQDVQAVEDLIGGEPAHLVGHSYGGLIAWTLARRAPERVLSIASYDPVTMGVLHDPPDPESLPDMQNTQALTDDTLEPGSESWLERFIDWWNAPGAWRALPQPQRDAFLQVGWKMSAEVRSLLTDRTPASAYSRVRAPVLLMRGEFTPVAARRVSDRLAEALPQARLVDVEGAGHMGPITHAPLVNSLVVEHIKADPNT